MRTLEALQADLRHALLAGEDTTAIRQAIAQAEAAERADEQRRADAAEARAADEAERIRCTAEELAAAATTRIEARIAELQPPPAPIIGGVG